MSTEPSREPLPFEPRQKRQKPAKEQSNPTPSQKAQKTSNQKPQKAAKPKSAPAPAKTVAKKDKPTSATRESMTIPDAVSKRMARRMAILSGIPAVLGISTFFVSYFLVKNAGLKLPNVAVVLVSMGFFGLSVLGLSYGVISASWDEEM
ncbi:MAG: PAM68 family protein, partial [Coleofasciculus sp. S288]|nr:PAM68 family protein [Coleofasciculus sp. S288]